MNAIIYFGNIIINIILQILVICTIRVILIKQFYCSKRVNCNNTNNDNRAFSIHFVVIENVSAKSYNDFAILA